MNNEEIIYSNDLSEVNKVIEEITSEEFRKRFILESGYGLLYVYKGKKHQTMESAVKELEEAGYKKEDIHLIETGGCSYNDYEIKFLADKNNQWLDIIVFKTSTQIRNQDTFSIPSWGTSVYRIYRDNKFKCYRKDGDKWYINTNVRSEDSIEEMADLNYGLRNKNEILQYLGICYNDIDNTSHKSMKSYWNYQRYLSYKAKTAIKQIFERVTEDKIQTWTDFRKFVRKPGSCGSDSAASKARATKKELLENEFLPIIKQIVIPKKELDPIEKARAEKDGFHLPNNRYYQSSFYDCFHRVEDWIIFSNGKEQRFFYNVKTNKKYCVNYYPDSEWREIGNIGVFRFDDLIHALNNFENYYYYNDSVTFYPNSCNGVYSYGVKTIQVRFKDADYNKAPKCFNEINEEISPEECFKGTIVLDFLKEEKDLEFFSKRDSQSDAWTSLGTFEDIVKLNRCPGIAFLLLCVKKDRRQIAEQLYKLKLNGFLLKLLTDPNSFKEKSDGTNYNTFLSYDKNGTNLKKAFNIPMDKIRVYDKIIQKDYFEKHLGRTKAPNLTDLQEVLGENLFTIDNTTFEGYVDYMSKFSTSSWQIRRLVNEMNTKGPKEVLKALEKIGNPSTYSDYLRLRQQYLNYFDEDRKKELEKIYKEMPDKARKFKYINESVDWNGRPITVETQLNSLSQRYAKCTAVYNELHQVIGAALELTTSETINFLHDELQTFITAYQREKNAEGFKEAAKRLLKYEYTGKELSIVAPKESKELAIEGGVLHHCVAGFVDAVIRGSENVLFIRRNDMKESPYYTMALSPDGRIEQIHGYRNNNLGIKEQEMAWAESHLDVYNKNFDLIKFLHEWVKTKKGLVTEGTIRESYGALGAR